MHSTDEIFKWVAEILRSEFQIRDEDLRLSAHLVDDLDLDSLDAVDLTMRIEEKTGIDFSVEDLKSIRTLQDVVDLIHERL